MTWVFVYCFTFRTPHDASLVLTLQSHGLDHQLFIILLRPCQPLCSVPAYITAYCSPWHSRRRRAQAASFRPPTFHCPALLYSPTGLFTINPFLLPSLPLTLAWTSATCTGSIVPTTNTLHDPNGPAHCILCYNPHYLIASTVNSPWHGRRRHAPAASSRRTGGRSPSASSSFPPRHWERQ